MSRYQKMCQVVPFCATSCMQVKAHTGTCLAHGTTPLLQSNKRKKRNKYIGNTRSVRARIQYLGDMMKEGNKRSEAFDASGTDEKHVPRKQIRHFRNIRSACLGCAKPVHLVRMSDGTYEWQHDGVPTAEMMERHRERGVGRQPVCTGRALELIAKSERNDHE